MIRASLFLLFIVSGSTAPAQPDTILVIPGQGIDQIVVGHASVSDVRHYRNMNFKNTGGGFRLGYACGAHRSYRFRSTGFVNDSAGLTFDFRSSNGNALTARFYKMKLREIAVSKNAKTADGLIVGKSTKQDVIRLYGLPAGWKNDRYIAYYTKGIAFTFKDNSGTIEEIRIFKPSARLITESF